MSGHVPETGAVCESGTDWAIGLFSSRESEHQLFENIRAALGCERDCSGLIVDIIVNGNPRLARSIQTRLAEFDLGSPDVAVRLWHLEQADKAAAWNHYLHEIAPPNALSFFIDGYVTLDRTCLRRMASAISERAEALAVTCMPFFGRSAKRMRQMIAVEGGLYGNVYALTAQTMERLRSSGFRLPIGIYRTDPALSAALAFNLDPARYPWRSDRVVVLPDAVYRVPELSALKWSDIKVALKRRLRQAQGRLESRAVREIFAIRHEPVSSLPLEARDMVLNWASKNPAEVKSMLWADPLAFAMLARLRSKAVPSSVPLGGLECIQQLGRAGTR